MSEFDFPDADEPDAQPLPAKKNYEDDIYKKWFRTKSKSGFLSIRGALNIGKVAIDIGETGSDSLKSSTMVYANAVDLAVFLRAVTEGRGKDLFPKNRDSPSPEGFTHYGGSKNDGKVISRLFKIHHWQTGSGDNKSFDSSAFVWKCGHFEGRETDSGAFVPDMSKALGANLIKVSRREMATISYRLDLAIQAFAARTEDPFRSLNGNAGSR